MTYVPADTRYATMPYRRAGRSGLSLPPISLGLWHNFGIRDDFPTARAIIRKCFDVGINHFDLANNYGPPAGAAETTFARILSEDLAPFRDELTITTKAGYLMWPGPFGDGGSRKYLLASLDQSLKRLKLDYVDVFYHHRHDPDTPIEESMRALDHAVRSGKALYAGVSNYGVKEMEEAVTILRSLGTPFVLNQPRYNLLSRDIEHGLLDLLNREGIGCAVYSPLAQGILTDKYLGGIPEDSRAARPDGFLQPSALRKDVLAKVEALNAIALSRGQSLAQMALSWVLRNPQITSVIVGVRTLAQLDDNLAALHAQPFDESELVSIDNVLKGDEG